MTKEATNQPEVRYLPAGTVVANLIGIELTLTGECGQQPGGRWYYKTINPNHGIWPEDIVRIVSVPEGSVGNKRMGKRKMVEELRTEVEKLRTEIAEIRKELYSVRDGGR